MTNRFLATMTLAISLISISSYSQISVKDVVFGKYIARSAGEGIRSTKDGNSYTMINKEHNAILRYSFETGALIDTIFSVKTARDCSFNSFQDYIISDDNKQVLLLLDIEYIYRRSYKANVFHYEVSRRKVEPLSETIGKIMIPTFSPDGRMVAFVRNGDIFIKKFDYGTEARVTKDAEYNHILNGITDWVYEEEFSVTNLMSFSSDGNSLAFIKTDESEVLETTIPFYHEKSYPSLYKYKYPKAGSENSKVSLHLYDIKLSRSKEVSFPKLKSNSLNNSFANSSVDDIYYIPRIEFNGNSLYCITLNRRQNLLSMYSIDRGSLIPKIIMQDRDNNYIESENINQLQFVDNGYVYPSEKDGYNHIYLYSNNGNLIRKITSGNWDVTKLYGMDKKGNIYYQAIDKAPMYRAVYRISKTGETAKLSLSQGTNDVIFSSNYKYYINRYSNLSTPTITELYSVNKKNPLRVLEDNKELKESLNTINLPKKEFLQIPNGEGDTLNAWIVKPIDFNPQNKYPVLMMQYSGPGSQQVLDKFSIGWEYALASKGYIVVDADGRGTGSRGAKFKKCTYMKLGILESDDQIAVAKYLQTLPFVKHNKIGIWGWSFGGYMTLMSLTRGDGIFTMGIAVAPVSDWKYYDSIYTERYMRTPQENPQGYELSSALQRASDLKGRLLIIHGSADDNVHLQNTMDFTERLVQSGISFEEAIYTDKNHGIYGGNTRMHLYKKMTDFLDKSLK